MLPEFEAAIAGMHAGEVKYVPADVPGRLITARTSPERPRNSR
jgi:hypothetical protein